MSAPKRKRQPRNAKDRASVHGDKVLDYFLEHSKRAKQQGAQQAKLPPPPFTRAESMRVTSAQLNRIFGVDSNNNSPPSEAAALKKGLTRAQRTSKTAAALRAEVLKKKKNDQGLSAAPPVPPRPKVPTHDPLPPPSIDQSLGKRSQRRRSNENLRIDV